MRKRADIRSKGLGDARIAPESPAAQASSPLSLADAILIAMILVGWLFILLARPSDWAPGAVSFPELKIETGAQGVKTSKLDYARWTAAFAAAGLPDPPNFSGADPVPIRVLLDAAMAAARAPVGRDAGALGRMGQVYQAIEEHEAAAMCFAAAAKLDPASSLWAYHLGASCESLGLLDEALRQFETARRLDPEYATTYARLAALYLERNDLDAAEANYHLYIKRRLNESLGYVGLGRVALGRGDREQAVSRLRQAVEKTPGDFLAHHFLSRALAAVDNPEDARSEADIAARLPRYSGWLSFDERLKDSHRIANTQRYLENKMRQATQRRDHAAMMESAEALLERRPNDYSMLANLASVYRHVGRLSEAQAAVERATALKPDSADLHCIRAEIAFARRDFPVVHQQLDAALELDAALARAHDLRGRALFLEGRTDEGLAAIRKAVAQDPTNVSHRLALAEMLKQSGQTEESLKELKSALRLDPDNATARSALQALQPSASEK